LSKPFRWEKILQILTEHLQVEYVYESTANRDIANSQPQPSNLILNDAVLTIMPQEWINQLNVAAAQGNDLKCLNLVAQIPPEQISLIAALTQLIDSYQFDQLLTLTQPFNCQ
jgi:two-component system sensor histidine kinase/response regulator